MVKRAWEHNLAERLKVLEEIGATKKQIEKTVRDYQRIIKSIERK
jgi:chorismate mutase